MGQQYDTTELEKTSLQSARSAHNSKHVRLALRTDFLQRSGRIILRRLLFSLLFLLLLFLGNSISRDGNKHFPWPNTSPRDSDYYDVGAPFAPYKIQRLWASYAPYYSVEQYKAPPQDCRLTQVNILQRHGARYPKRVQSAPMKQALLKLQAGKTYTDEKLHFVMNYQYDLGTGDLLPYGEHETFESGRKSFIRYPSLTDQENLPFIRASGSDRVIKSALKWIQGFSSGRGGVLQPQLSVIIPEDGYNNTLQFNSCPKADHPSAPMKVWQRIYAQPIADWLNAVAPGLPESITSEDAQALMTLCAFETIAKEQYSPFCNLFTDVDFEGFEYAFDVDKFYSVGYGAPLGPVQGVGYINELIARLTDSPVHDHTQTNYTLDSNPATFPLKRGIYVDFSHDRLMTAVISAMGLFRNNGPVMGGKLDPMRRQETRDWWTSRIVPFSGRMVVERMECGLGNGRAVQESEVERGRRRQASRDDSVYVRILVNDAVRDLDFCEDATEDGLCSVQSFVKSQAYAREDGQGDWEKCFE